MLVENSSNRDGKFIVFEGIDGCGKSTQIEALKKYFDEYNLSFIIGEEPSDEREIGKFIRDFLHGDIDVPIQTLGPLMVADRIDHTFSPNDYGIIQNLRKGNSYLSSRWYLSTIAYEGVDYGVDYVRNMNQIFPDKLHADLTIYLDIPIDVAINRLHSGREEMDLMERETDRLKKIKAIYDDYILNPENPFMESEHIVVVDGTLPEKEITSTIFGEIVKIMDDSRLKR